MQPGLNYDKHDPKFILLGKVFKFRVLAEIIRF